ncbi:hypothetical protein D2Q93_10770 [Alicyclobacillaceae bacterium I2511]|nr:hypothetical protein D2Q93_10770 [Alicyclobacillaceae bacterium I2511]
MSIRQPVAVKFILTEDTKQQILTEQRRQIEQITASLEQLEQGGRQALEQAMAQGGDVAAKIKEQVEQQKQSHLQQREQLIQQIQQIQQMSIGTEVPNMNVETTVEVHVGDDWGKILLGSEVIVKDGIVHEIRRGGQSWTES